MGVHLKRGLGQCTDESDESELFLRDWWLILGLYQWKEKVVSCLIFR